jgi:hypothetical protein
MSERIDLSSLYLDDTPRPGGKTDYRIGIIGCGGIVQASHLPAYRSAGFRVAGIWNRTRETADGVASRFGIPKVFRPAKPSRRTSTGGHLLPPTCTRNAYAAAAAANTSWSGCGVTREAVRRGFSGAG